MKSLEREQLADLCQKMGATPEQSNHMASQLLKRADQLVIDRNLTRVEALQYLLGLLVKGRSGESPEGFEGTKRTIM